MSASSRASLPADLSDEPLAAVDAVMLNNRRVFFGECLKVKTKGGRFDPFRMNRAQEFIDLRLDEQLQRAGKVRALILKGRQTGGSTYVAGRYYHRTVMSFDRAIRTYILSHEKKSTKHLLSMPMGFYRNCPPEYRPMARITADSIAFPLLGSDYQVATAKTGDTGRSNTIHLFHGSEVAFWPHPEEIATGALQAVPNEPGTEVILESTANGLGGWFYDMWQAAEKGESDYIAIFVPWFWSDEYRAPAPDGFKRTEDEDDIVALYGLDGEQLAWRRAKIKELGSLWRFKQEYPCNAVEAFQTKGAEGLINSDDVMRARKAVVEEPEDWVARVLGVDCARSTDEEKGDATRLIDRKGRAAGRLVNETFRTKDTMRIATRVAEFIASGEIDKAFVDVGGIGAGVYDRLVQLGYRDRVVAVNFGGKPIDPTRYVNKRAEMWGKMKDWLTDDAQPSIPEDDTLHRHICAPMYDYDDNQRLKLEKKKDIKKRLKFSPDGGDALALTFAAPVVKPEALHSPATRLRRLQRAAQRPGFMGR